MEKLAHCPVSVNELQIKWRRSSPSSDLKHSIITQQRHTWAEEKLKANRVGRRTFRTKWTSLMKHHQTCDSVRVIFIITSTSSSHPGNHRTTHWASRERVQLRLYPLHLQDTQNMSVWTLRRRSAVTRDSVWPDCRNPADPRGWIPHKHPADAETEETPRQLQDKSTSSIISETNTFPLWLWAHVTRFWKFHDRINKIYQYYTLK